MGEYASHKGRYWIVVEQAPADGRPRGPMPLLRFLPYAFYEIRLRAAVSDYSRASASRSGSSPSEPSAKA